MPGGLICEMETLCDFFSFFILVLKILARTKRLCSYHMEPCNNWRLPGISFSIRPARLLFASHTRIGCHSNAINTREISCNNYIYRAGE